MATKTLYHDLIVQVAGQHGLEPRMVEAVVLQESGGNTDAFRFEPKFYARYLAKLPACKGLNPRRISSSYGLMQLMYWVAKELGFQDEPETLFVPAIGLEWGCRKLAELWAWSGQDLDSTWAAYNGGKADNAPGHQPALRNGSYARSVRGIYQSLQP